MEFGLETIYLICAIAGGAVLVIRFILMIIGLDHGDTLPDLGEEAALGPDEVPGAEDGSGSSFNFLSIQSLAGFFTMFGLVGLGLLQIELAEIWSLAGALAAGVFTAWCTGLVFMAMRRLQSEGTLVMENAVGQTGTVYLTIPENGTGAVSVTVQGALRTLDAVSENGQRIPTGSIVRVVRITAGKILVVAEKPAES